MLPDLGVEGTGISDPRVRSDVLPRWSLLGNASCRAQRQVLGIFAPGVSIEEYVSAEGQIDMRRAACSLDEIALA